MRRGGASFLALATVAALVSAGIGLTLVDDFRSLLAEGPGAARDFAQRLDVRAHALSGHVAAACAVLGASMAFVVALQRLLAGGRRPTAAALSLSAPLVVAAALAAEVSGFGEWDRVELGELSVLAVETHLRTHATGASAALLSGLLVTWALLAWVRRPLEGEV